MANTVHDNFHATALAAVNEALVTLGNDTVLSALSATSDIPESRKAAYIYNGSRLKVLRDHDWNFARREVPMGTCPTPTLCGDPLRNAYIAPVPARCVRLLACTRIDGRVTEWTRSGDTIRARDPIASIFYTYDEENLDKWSPDAYRALILRLASDLAKPITGRINERQLQEEAYARVLEDAKLADARESNVPQDPWQDNPYVEAMRGAHGAWRNIPRPDILSERGF